MYQQQQQQQFQQQIQQQQQQQQHQIPHHAPSFQHGSTSAVGGGGGAGDFASGIRPRSLSEGAFDYYNNEGGSNINAQHMSPSSGFSSNSPAGGSKFPMFHSGPGSMYGSNSKMNVVAALLQQQQQQQHGGGGMMGSSHHHHQHHGGASFLPPGQAQPMVLWITHFVRQKGGVITAANLGSALARLHPEFYGLLKASHGGLTAFLADYPDRFR